MDHKNYSRFSPDLLAVLILLALCPFFFWRLFPLDSDDQLVVKHNTDFASQSYNYSGYQAARFDDGDLFPLWNPYNLGGNPFLADSLSEAAYPVRWLFMALYRGDWSYGALENEVVFHFALISLLMYALVRRLTGRVLGGLVASIAFTYGGFLQSYPILQMIIVEAGTWLPLVILGVYEGTRRGRRWWGWWLLAGIGLALTFLAGHPQTTLMTGYLALAYALYRTASGSRHWGQMLAGLAIFGAVGAGLCAIVALPTVEYLPISARSEALSFVDKSIGYGFANIFQLFWTTPGLYSPWYIGLLGLALIVLAGLYRRQESIFWLAAAAVALLIGFGGKTALYQSFYVFLPGFNMFQHFERALLIGSFAAAILIGQGAVCLVSHVIEERDQTRLRRALWIMACVAAVYFMGIYNLSGGEYDNLNKDMAAYTLMVAVLVALILPWVQDHPTLGRQGVLVGLLVFDLFSATQGSSYPYQPGDSDDVLPEPSWAQALRPLLAADPFARVDSNGHLEPYGTLYSVPDIEGTWLIPLRLSHTDAMRALPEAVRWELFAVRWVPSGSDLPVPATRLEGEYYDYGQTFSLYELDDPRPLASLVYGWNWFDDEEAIGVLSAPDYPIRDRVVLPDPPPIDLPDSRPDVSSVTLQKIEPERLSLDAKTGDKTLLLVSIPYDSGWRARVDGHTTDVIRADVGLMAVPLAPGSHHVELVYEPRGFRYGRWITAITLLGTLIALAVWIVLLHRDRKRDTRALVPVGPNRTPSSPG